MTKSILIILYILIALLIGGFSYPCDSIYPEFPQTSDSLDKLSDNKFDLPDIEETYSFFNYDTVLQKYSGIIPQGASVTKFRHFIVFSLLDDNLTYRLIDNDIRNTILAMENNLCSKTPVSVTPVFLFKEFNEYKKFVQDNYEIDENDISPYGFYKVSKNVIIVRYVSWKGSIAHEVTHKFTNTDFPGMPSWFDEGLSSLHEKSEFKNGELIGDFSLRIIPLRRALKENTYTLLETLMTTDDKELYGKKASYYYAQSRYLLMMIQQSGLLAAYYKTFRDTFNIDKTGISQLEQVTGKPISVLNEELISFIRSFDNKN